MAIKLRRLVKALQWKELIPIDEWAEKYYHLEPESAIGGGLYSFEYAPYLKLPMQSINYHNLNNYNFWFASQAGKTTLSMVTLNYFIDRSPSNIAFYLPNDNLVPSTASDRILPAIKRTPNAKNIEEEKEINKLKDNTKIIRFGGGILKILSANSAANRKSFPAKYIFLDETSEFKKSHVSEIEERNKTYADFGGKIIKTSTSLTANDPCVLEHKKADCIMEYFIKCPKCGNEHIDDFIKNVRYEELKGDLEDDNFKAEYIKHARDTAYYECPYCKAKLNDKLFNKAVEKGRWKAVRGDIKKDKKVSFRASSMLSFFVSIGYMVDKYLNCGDDEELLRSFYNGYLSKIFSPKKKQKSHNELLPLISDEMAKGEIWSDTLTIAGAVDVQKDHYYYIVVAFKEGVAVHICDYGRVENEIDLQYKILQGYTDQDDNIQYVEKWAIDSGYDTKNVYDLVEHLNSLNDMAEFDETLKEIFDKRQGIPVDVIPIKGANREMNVISHITTIESDINGKKYDDSLKLHTINTKMFKDNAQGYIDRSLNPEYEGKKRLSIHSEAGDDILKSFVSEHKVEVETKTGTRYEWRPVNKHPFNHYWDCFVYCLYLGEKLDVRFRKPIIKKVAQKAPPPKREHLENEFIVGDWIDEY